MQLIYFISNEKQLDRETNVFKIGKFDKFHAMKFRFYEYTILKI